MCCLCAADKCQAGGNRFRWATVKLEQLGLECNLCCSWQWKLSKDCDIFFISWHFKRQFRYCLCSFKRKSESQAFWYRMWNESAPFAIKASSSHSEVLCTGSIHYLWCLSSRGNRSRTSSINISSHGLSQVMLLETEVKEILSVAVWELASYEPKFLSSQYGMGYLPLLCNRRALWPKIQNKPTEKLFCIYRYDILHLSRASLVLWEAQNV